MLHECAEALDLVDSIVGGKLPSVRTPKLPVTAHRASRHARADATSRSILPRLAYAVGGAVARYSAVCRSRRIARTPWGLLQFTARFYGYAWGVRDIRGFAAAAIRRLRGQTQTFGPSAR